MTSAVSHRKLASMIAVLLLAGCAQQPAKPAKPVSSTATTAATSSTQASAASGTRPQHHGTSSNAAAANIKLPDHTGIAACDDYLSSYLACHRAAGIFAPDQLQSRYQMMRTGLLRDSMDPDIRPQLAARCNSLATELREALHGKSCEENPAPGGTSP